MSLLSSLIDKHTITNIPCPNLYSINDTNITINNYSESKHNFVNFVKRKGRFKLKKYYLSEGLSQNYF